MGCPKLDNPQEYVDKFAEIFRVANIKSIRVPSWRSLLLRSAGDTPESHGGRRETDPHGSRCHQHKKVRY